MGNHGGDRLVLQGLAAVCSPRQREGLAPLHAAAADLVAHLEDQLVRALFHAVESEGGRLVAQCGGYGNIAGFRALADDVSAEPPFKPYLDGWTGPWYYATPEDTRGALASGSRVAPNTSNSQ